MLLIGTLVLLVSSVAVGLGLGVGLVMVPWLMLLARYLLRPRKPSDLSAARREGASQWSDDGEGVLTRPGRGPIPVH
jgi:hypothetical protein